MLPNPVSHCAAGHAPARLPGGRPGRPGRTAGKAPKVVPVSRGPPGKAGHVPSLRIQDGADGTSGQGRDLPVLPLVRSSSSAGTRHEAHALLHSRVHHVAEIRHHVLELRPRFINLRPGEAGAGGAAVAGGDENVCSPGGKPAWGFLFLTVFAAALVWWGVRCAASEIKARKIREQRGVPTPSGVPL